MKNEAVKGYSLPLFWFTWPPPDQVDFPVRPAEFVSASSDRIDF